MLPVNWVCCLHESEFSPHENWGIYNLVPRVSHLPASGPREEGKKITDPQSEVGEYRALPDWKCKWKPFPVSSWGLQNVKHSLSHVWKVWKLSSFCQLRKAVSSSITVELQNFTTKQRKNSLACGFDAAFLPNVFRVVEQLSPKLFNPAQVALTKILRNKAKIYQKTDFLSSEGHLLTSPGCCLT